MRGFALLGILLANSLVFGIYALAYTAMLMVVCKAGVLRWLTRGLAAIGQTALSAAVA